MDGSSWAGGDRLKAYLDKAAEAASSASEVRVGFLENATEPNGASTAMVAAIQNYGAPKAGIPPRPFFSNMIAAHKDEWGPDIAAILKSDGMSAERALSLMGEQISGQLRDEIVALDSPPLSPVTLMLRMMKIGRNSPITFDDVIEARRRVKAGEVAKGVSVKPLVDTGALFQGVDYEVS